VIAEANGITSANDIVAGVSIAIPTGVASNRNDFRTFKPYDPATIKGDTSPTLPVPQGHNGCGTMGTILIAVIAIAATVVTAGASAIALEGAATLSSAVGTAAAGTSLASAGVVNAGLAVLGGASTVGFETAVIAGAAGGIAGSIAGQGAEIVGGVRDSFSLRDIATAGITGGLSVNGHRILIRREVESEFQI